MANISMEKLKPLLSLKFALILLALLGLFFASRLINLTKIPVFVDEAIYIRWAQVMRHEPTLRFLPLSDGKQPLFMWLMIPLFKFISDPLFAGRLVSVLAGLGTLFGVLALTFYISSSLLATSLAGLLYIVIPFTLFFDRMALVDSLLSMFAIWSFFLGLLFTKYRRLDLAMLLGFTIGFATLTKSPGWFFLYLQPILLIAYPPKTRKQFFSLIFGWLTAGAIALGMYNILRLGPNFNLLASRTADYIFPLREVISHPLNPFTTHAPETFFWLLSLLTIPVSLILIPAILHRPRRYTLPLFLWSVLALLAQAGVAKAYTSRYFLYTIPPLLVIIALYLSYALTHFKKGIGIILTLIVIVFPLIKSVHVLLDPVSADIPANMHEGYFEEWTAGYGQKEIADYLINTARDRSVVVGTDGYFGTLPDGLAMYTESTPHLTVIGGSFPITGVPDPLANSLKDPLNRVFLVVNKSRDKIPPSQLQKFKLLAVYPKPPRANGTFEELRFYELLP